MGAVWRIAFYGLVILIFAYLLFPILVVIPLSFSSGKYLTFPPPGFSLQWYMNFFTRSAWTDSAWLSIWVGLAVTALSTLLGTPAAIGLVRGKFAGKKLVNALILSPVIAPGIIVAIGLYFAYASYGLVGRPLALVLGHTALAVPFVVINVSSTLYGVDRRLEYAALSLGASPWATFRQVTLPLIRPGIFAGAVFAFITSFDELLVALFLSGTTAVTLPRRMWEQIRFDIDPTLASVSTLLITITTSLMVGAPAAQDAARRARALPGLRVGLHLTLAARSLLARQRTLRVSAALSTRQAAAAASCSCSCSKVRLSNTATEPSPVTSALSRAGAQDRSHSRARACHCARSLPGSLSGALTGSAPRRR